MQQKEFVQWLIQYKEYSSEKANNVEKRLNSFSDKCFESGVSDRHWFENSTFAQFTKWRISVSKDNCLTSSEKKDLDLFGDFLQIQELTHISYDVFDVEKLKKYCDSMKMSYSYKPVTILAMLEAVENGSVSTEDDVVTWAISYYKKRLHEGLIVEKPDSIFSSGTIDFLVAKKVIESNPITVLEKAGVINRNPQNGQLAFSSEYYVEKNSVAGVREACLKRLEAYYSSLSENQQKDDDPYERLKDLIDSIQEDKLRSDCVDAFGKICEANGIKLSIAIPDKTVVSTSSLYIDSDDERKIGRLVRETMELLSKSGFSFEEGQLSLFYSKEWSKKTLGLFYPLFKEYKRDVPIEEQTKDYLNNNRYYAKVYSFGAVEVLLTSEWYKESRQRYINWFNELLE